MAATHLSLLGSFTCDLYETVTQRLAQSATSGSAFDTHEYVLERGSNFAKDAQIGADESVVRLRSTRLAANPDKTTWTLMVFQRPESARLSPEVVTRAVIICAFDAPDPLAFVSSLGYSLRFQLFKRGVRFARGPLVFEIYQHFSGPDAVEPLDKQSHLIALETLIANQVSQAPPQEQTGNDAKGKQVAQQAATSMPEMRAAALVRMREWRAVLRGLVAMSPVIA